MAQAPPFASLNHGYHTTSMRWLGLEPRGKWIVELPELSALRRSEIETIKAFVTRSTDYYRPSYGRRAEDFPRQCIFIGSTNADGYLGDETGNRRFWPVKVGKVDLKGLRRDRDQLWAEAVVAFARGDRWWLDAEAEALARAEQAERQPEDPWTGTVLAWAETHQRFVIENFLMAKVGGLGMAEEDVADRESKRVANILRREGWVRGKQIRIDGKRRRPYEKPSLVSPVDQPTGDTTGDTYYPKNLNENSAPVTPDTRELDRTRTAEPTLHTFQTIQTDRNRGDTGDTGDTLIEEVL